MNLLPELQELEALKNGSPKVPINILLPAGFLTALDAAAKNSVLSRGDFLAACALRVMDKDEKPTL